MILKIPQKILKIKALWKHYFDKMKCIIFMVDLSKNDRIDINSNYSNPISIRISNIPNNWELKNLIKYFNDNIARRRTIFCKIIF